MMTTEIHDKNDRTCAGCGKKAAPAALVRLVLGPKDSSSGAQGVAVDAAGGAFGRGGHVHPNAACIGKACAGGLARTFKGKVEARPDELSAAISDAFLRRAEGLLVSARRARAVAIGGDEARSALAAGCPLVVVASDAKSIIARTEIASAIAEGRACTWLGKTELGKLLGKDEVAVCAVTDARMATALAEAVRTAQSVRAKDKDGSWLEDR
jgi:uncharacterized protein